MGGERSPGVGGAADGGIREEESNSHKGLASRRATLVAECILLDAGLLELLCETHSPAFMANSQSLSSKTSSDRLGALILTL